MRVIVASIHQHLPLTPKNEIKVIDGDFIYGHVIDLLSFLPPTCKALVNLKLLLFRVANSISHFLAFAELQKNI
jgi:hypothetical protein